MTYTHRCVPYLLPTFRALYSLIQFTTITLLYSFASSLGDFQVRLINCLMSGQSNFSCQFIFHSSFTSICLLLSRLPSPVSLPTRYVSAGFDGYLSFSSGSLAAVPSNTSKATDGEPSLQKGPCQYHWTDNNNKCRAVLGLLMGEVTELVSPQLTAGVKLLR